MTATPRLSKSRLLAFRQCPRRLWLEINEPELTAPSDGSRAIMATGNAVGDIARRLHPGGILIGHQDNLAEALRETRHLLAMQPRVPLFEATFEHDDVLVRADLLLPADGNRWHAVEVKSSARVKDYQLTDAAIQTYVMAGAGVALAGTAVQVINSAFVYPGNGCYEETRPDGSLNSLFARHDVTRDIATLMHEVGSWITAARDTLAGGLPPMTDNCDTPYECPFKDHCHAGGPEYPVAWLPRIGARAAELKAEGWFDIREVPDDVLKSDIQDWVRRVTVAGQPELRPGAREAMAKIGYPRGYLDFETIAFAVPIWAGTRPFQQIPFQWSFHVEDGQGSLGHREYLDITGEHPARRFAEALVAEVSGEGPVLVYNRSFEAGVIRGLAEGHPDLAAPLLAIEKRLVDLQPIARDNYYHPDMRGSWSIKSVLPTIDADLDYALLDGVQHGIEAQQAYVEAIDPATDEERRASLRAGLLAYCERDTEAMVRLAEFLAGSV